MPFDTATATDFAEPAAPVLLYAHFWQRFCAMLIDAVVLLPLGVCIAWVSSMSRIANVALLVPTALFSLWFYVHLVKCHGGTPGKLIMGIRIAKVDGSAIGYREALLRHAVSFTFEIIEAVAMMVAAYSISEASFEALTFGNRPEVLQGQFPDFFKYLVYVQGVWGWGELLVMLTNKQRRSLHDFIAGTVVLRKP
jgi:uncharacterized RDD family membrane protein YckC